MEADGGDIDDIGDGSSKSIRIDSWKIFGKDVSKYMMKLCSFLLAKLL